MKFGLVILLALMGLVSASEFIAYPSSSLLSSGCNCRGDNYPNPVELSVSIMDPSSLPLSLSYEWYDPNIAAYRQGDWIECAGNTNVLFGQGVGSCRLRIYTPTGGMNGTTVVNVVLLGTNGYFNYSTSFDVQVNYRACSFEDNVVSRIQGVEQDFDQLRYSLGGSCYGNSCCGMLASNNYLNLALGNLSLANFSLRECLLANSWSYALNASNSITSASQSFILLNNNCSAAISMINETDLRIASSEGFILAGKKCGSDVSLAEAQLANANSSLSEAEGALASDDYDTVLLKIREANSSIHSSLRSIGNCPTSPPKQTPVVTPVTKQNSTNSSPSPAPSSGNNTLLIAGGAFMALLILAALAAVLLTFMRKQPRKEEGPKPQPEMQAPAPPAQPPAAPPAETETREDLEKEFNEWLSSHPQKK